MRSVNIRRFGRGDGRVQRCLGCSAELAAAMRKAVR